MKKNVVFFVFILFLSNIYSDEINIHPKYLIKIFKSGADNGQLAYTPKGMGMGVPQGIGFDAQGNFYVSDQGLKRLVEFNSDFIFKKNYSKNRILSNFIRIEFIDNSFLIRGFSRGIVKIDFNQNNIFNLSLGKLKEFDSKELPYNDLFLLFKNIILFYDKKHNVHCIINPSNNHEDNIKNYRDTEATKKLLKSKYKELTITDKNWIIHNGKILTRIYDDYIAFWEEQHGKQTPPANSISFDIAKEYTSLTYYGSDNDKNQYWGDKGVKESFILIFDNKGWLIDRYKLENFNDHLFPAIHPRGDVFYLDIPQFSDEKDHELYMVQRVWGYDNITTGKCTEDKVQIRLMPSTKIKSIGYLMKDDTFEILTRTDNKEKIGKWNNYWYKIRTNDGKVGWAFGEFIKEVDQE